MLFLLKEPNSPHDIGWSIPGELQKQVRSAEFATGFPTTWRAGGKWSYAIHHFWPSREWPKWYELGDKESLEGVAQLAMTNLKKTGGTGEANQRTVAEYARKTKDIWTRELEIMDPQLILCCGTYWIVAHSLNVEIRKLVDEAGTAFYYSGLPVNGHLSLVVDFRHPARSGQTVYERLGRFFGALKSGKEPYFNSKLLPCNQS